MEQKTFVERPRVSYLVSSIALLNHLHPDSLLVEQLADRIVDFSGDAFGPRQENLYWDRTELHGSNLLAHNGRFEDLANDLRTCYDCFGVHFDLLAKAEGLICLMGPHVDRVGFFLRCRRAYRR